MCHLCWPQPYQDKRRAIARDQVDRAVQVGAERETKDRAPVLHIAEWSAPPVRMDAAVQFSHGKEPNGYACKNFAKKISRKDLKDAKRSEEHTSELQSPCNLVCRLLLEKKKKYNN